MNLALFDFDGTITTVSAFPAFMEVAIAPKRLAIGKCLLAPMLLGYKLGVVGPGIVRRSVAYAGFRGARESAVRAAGLLFSRDFIPRILRDEAMDRIAWHKAQGDLVVVVSASLDAYLAPWCEHHGVALICNTLASQGGVLSGRFLDGDCDGRAKVRRIRERYDLHRFPVVYAYGDTDEDRGMLDLANRKFLCWKEMA